MEGDALIQETVLKPPGVGHFSPVPYGAQSLIWCPAPEKVDPLHYGGLPPWAYMGRWVGYDIVRASCQKGTQ